MLEWNPEYASGSDLIDEQHKELFKRVNSLLTACQEGHSRQEVDIAVKFVEEYVVMHFATEEEYMEKYQYPQTADHKDQHNELVESFLKMKERLAHSKLLLPEVLSLHNFLVDWARLHTMKTDKELGAFLKAHNVDEELHAQRSNQNA